MAGVRGRIMSDGRGKLTADDFRRALAERFDQAARAGSPHVDIKSGELHREVGGYPGHDHRMPLCCNVMNEATRAGDKVLSAPPSGKGATLVIRYKLPRPTLGQGN